jgi:hypothetical protein
MKTIKIVANRVFLLAFWFMTIELVLVFCDKGAAVQVFATIALLVYAVAGGLMWAHWLLEKGVE